MLLMPKVEKYKWLSQRKGFVYNASVYPKSKIFTKLLNSARMVGYEDHQGIDLYYL